MSCPDPTSADPFAIERFQLAQDDNGTYERAAAELRAGRKTSHWMWFIFPGSIDAIKLRSSMTLFARVAPAEVLFRQVLEDYFDGARDTATEELMRGPAFA